MTPKSLRSTKQAPQKKEESSKEESDDSSDEDSDTDESSGEDEDDDNEEDDESSSDEGLKSSQKYLSARTAKGLVGSRKRSTRTSSAFKGLMKDAKRIRTTSLMLCIVIELY